MIDFAHRINAWIKISTPAVISLVLIIFSATNFQLPGLDSFVPLFAFMTIFYWAIYNPSLMPAWFVFVLGIFQDFIYGTPFGVASFVNLLLWWLAVSQRKYLIKERFIVFWLVFSVISLLFCLITSVLFSIYYQKFVLSNDIIMQWLFSAFIYPFLHKLFNVIHVVYLKN